MLTIDYSPERMRACVINSTIGLLMFIVAAVIGHMLTGCRPPGAAEVEAAYTSELTHCSYVAKSLAEAKACRHGVNVRYGLCDTAQWPNLSPCDE